MAKRTRTLQRGRKSAAKRRTKAAAPKLLTRPQLAAALGVTPMTITRWEQDGMPVAKKFTRGRSTLFDRAAVEAWREKADAAKGDELSLSAERAKSEQLKQEKLRLELDQRRGQYILRDQAVREGWAWCEAVRAKVRSLPRRAAQLGAIQPNQVPALEQLCRQMLEELGAIRSLADAQVIANGTAA